MIISYRNGSSQSADLPPPVSGAGLQAALRGQGASTASQLGQGRQEPVSRWLPAPKPTPYGATNDLIDLSDVPSAKQSQNTCHQRP